MVTVNLNCFYVYDLLRQDLPDPFHVWEDQPFYIGKGCNGRLYQHRKESRSALNKSGRKNIKINIIHTLWKNNLDFKEVILFDNLTEQEAFELERKLIAKYGRINNGTGILANLTDGGIGGVGRIFTEEHKRNISKSLIGLMVGEKSPWYGKPSPRKGKHHTEESKKKTSKSQKGKLKKKGNYHSWNKGLTIETDERVATSTKKCKETKRKNKKQPWNKGKKGISTSWKKGKTFSGIEVKINGVVYPSIKIASKKLGISETIIKYRFRNKFDGYEKIGRKPMVEIVED